MSRTIHGFISPTRSELQAQRAEMIAEGSFIEQYWCEELCEVILDRALEYGLAGLGNWASGDQAPEAGVGILEALATCTRGSLIAVWGD